MMKTDCRLYFNENADDFGIDKDPGLSPKRCAASEFLFLFLLRKAAETPKCDRDPRRLTHNANKFVARLHAANGATLSFIKCRQSIDFEMKKIIFGEIRCSAMLQKVAN